MVMYQLKQWWVEEKQKMTALSLEKRVAYFWEYYKLWIIGVVSAILILSMGIRQYVTTKPDNWFFACFANTHAELGEGSDFWKDFADYAGYDLNEKNLVFNAQCYCDPTKNNSSNQYYQLLIAYLDSGTLDVLIMEEERIQVIGAAGRLMDLEDERIRAVFERYKDRVIYCDPSEDDYGKELVPIGIDLSGTILTGENGAYAESAVLGVNALAPHPEQVAVFLSYLFEGAEQ